MTDYSDDKELMVILNHLESRRRYWLWLIGVRFHIKCHQDKEDVLQDALMLIWRYPPPEDVTVDTVGGWFSHRLSQAVSRWITKRDKLDRKHNTFRDTLDKGDCMFDGERESLGVVASAQFKQFISDYVDGLSERYSYSREVRKEFLWLFYGEECFSSFLCRDFGIDRKVGWLWRKKFEEALDKEIVNEEASR